MPQLEFVPETDGFAFNNTWVLEPEEFAVIDDIMIEVFHLADKRLQTFFKSWIQGGGTAAALAAPLVGSGAGLAVNTGLSAAVSAAVGTAVGGFVGAAVTGVLLGLGILGASSPEKFAKDALNTILRLTPTAGFCGGMAFTSLRLLFLEAGAAARLCRPEQTPQHVHSGG